MKDIEVKELPKCNYCDRPAVFDVPTVYGPWAYLCPTCAFEHSNPSMSFIGYHLFVKKGETPMPTPKAPEIDSLLTSLTGISRMEAATKGLCTWCKKPLTPFKDELSRKEYKISGMCQACQDVTFE